MAITSSSEDFPRSDGTKQIGKTTSHSKNDLLFKKRDKPGTFKKSLKVNSQRKALIKNAQTPAPEVKTFHLFEKMIEISHKTPLIERKGLSFSLEDLNVGAIVTGTAKKIVKNGIYVRFGLGRNGFIPNMHLTDAALVNPGKNREKLFAEKKQVKCRILRLDTKSKGPKITLTMKKTLLNMKESELFTDFHNIQSGASSTGVVCLVNEKGVLLEFFGRVCGFIPVKYLATYKIEHPEKVFSVGQLVKCNVISVDTEAQRMVCSLNDVNIFKELKIKTKLSEKKLQNSSLHVGQILKKLKISKVSTNGLDLTNQKQDIQVFLPLAHLSDDTYLSCLLYIAFKVGDTIEQVMVFSVDSSNVVTVTRKNTFLQENTNLVMKESDIELNHPFPVIIRSVTHNGVFFETPNSHYGVVRRRQLQDGFYEDPRKLGLLSGQTIYVSAVDLSHKENKNEDAKNLTKFKFSMKLSDVWDRESTAKVELMKAYLKDFSLAIDLFKHKAENDTSDKLNVENSFLTLAKKFISYTVGQVVTYMVTSITKSGIELKISLTGAKTEPTVLGLATKYTNFDDLNIGQMGNAVICDFDFERKAVLVFIQPQPAKIAKQVKNAQKLKSINNLKVDQSIKGTVIHIGQRFVLASLTGHAPGVIAYIPSRRHRNDFGQIEKLFTVGEDYHFLIKAIDENERVVAILKTGTKKSGKATQLEKGVTKLQNGKNDFKVSNLSSNNKLAKEPITLLSKDESSTLTSDQIESDQISSNDFQWNIPDLTPNLSKKRKVEDLKRDDKGLTESDTEEDASSLKKSKTRQERSEDARQRELVLRQKEIELCDLERLPQNEQDFEMAVVASPNSSLVWLKYMSFYLEKGDTAKAREIAERALERISFREEKEKLNIWIGLMNLENTFGDQSSMDALLGRAIKYNDAKTIYLQLASIYDNSDKKEKAEQIHHLTLKKFKQDSSVWIDFLVFYMQNGRLDSARKLFQKSILSLEKRDHVDVISKFAQLEFRYGDAEQGKTIFESMLATYWKRLDQWSIYIDMLVKYTLTTESEEGNLDAIEFIRNIFERLITFKLPPQKMKFIFKKYYDFESKFSAENSEILDKIKQKALEYIESDIF